MQPFTSGALASSRLQSSLQTHIWTFTLATSILWSIFGITVKAHFILWWLTYIWRLHKFYFYQIYCYSDLPEWVACTSKMKPAQVSRLLISILTTLMADVPSFKLRFQHLHQHGTTVSHCLRLQTIHWPYIQSTVVRNTNLLRTFFAHIWSGGSAFITENQQKNYLSLLFSGLALISDYLRTAEVQFGQSSRSQINKYLYLAHNWSPITIIGISTNILSGGLSNVR